MKTYTQRGLIFGATSGVVTVLGLISGLATGTDSRAVVIGGIVTIAIADSLSDAIGMHTSEESSRMSEKHIWTTTLITLFSKMILSLSFLIPFWLLDLRMAVLVSAIWGFLVVSLISWRIAKIRKIKAWKVIFEHVTVMALVILATSAAGYYINQIVK